MSLDAPSPPNLQISHESPKIGADMGLIALYANELPAAC